MDGDDITREGLILRIWARTRSTGDTPLDINGVVADIRRIAAAVDNDQVKPERPAPVQATPPAQAAAKPPPPQGQSAAPRPAAPQPSAATKQPAPMPATPPPAKPAPVAQQ